MVIVAIVVCVVGRLAVGMGTSSGVGESEPPAKRSKKGNRAVTLFERKFAELWPGSVACTGLSLDCRFHSECTRDCSFGKDGEVPYLEIARRLLRWEEAGSAVETKEAQEDLAKKSCWRTLLLK